MSEIQTISPRASVQQQEDGLSIVISSAADKKRARGIGILFVLWAGGGITTIVALAVSDAEKARVMLLVFAAFWLYFTYVMLKALLWQLKGREIIKIRDGKMRYKKDVQGRGWVQTYELSLLRNLRARPDDSSSWVNRFGGDYWSTDCDSLLFDYEDREIAFGYRLSEKESGKIRKLILSAQKKAQ